VNRLGSAPLPPISDDDHVRGPEDGPLLVEYGDFECPYCAVLWQRLEGLHVRRVFRHFPVRSSHPRAWASAVAAEAAALQGRFWEMHDSLFAGQSRLEDPHIWQRAEDLGLQLDRFDSDRRSEAVRARVKRDFDSGVRAGVVTTPTVFLDGQMYAGQAAVSLIERLASDRQRA
jgi:protein-disulfide isomerase